MFKHKIRKEVLKLRKKKNLNNIQIDITNIFKILKKHKLNKKILGSYFPVNYEIDTKEIMKAFDRKGYLISLPVIKKNFSMDFFKWKLNDPLYLNKFGIPEPAKKKN